MNDMPQAADCELLLYANGTCLIFQNKDITKISIRFVTGILVFILVKIKKINFIWQQT